MKNDLNNIVRRVEKLEEVVFGSGKRKPQKSKVGKSNKNNSLPDKILALRDSGFFKQPKTAIEVQTKFQSSYACEIDRVAMALLRLAKRKLLRITSKEAGGNKSKAYVW